MTRARQHSVLSLPLAGFILLSASAFAAQQTRSSAFEYDPATGLITKEIVEPGQTQLKLETTYTLDAYGNRTPAIVSSLATGQAPIRTCGSLLGAATYPPQHVTFALSGLGPQNRPPSTRGVVGTGNQLRNDP